MWDKNSSIASKHNIKNSAGGEPAGNQQVAQSVEMLKAVPASHGQSRAWS